MIVHTAASYKSPNDWYNDTLTNCVGGANIVEAAKSFNVKRLSIFKRLYVMAKTLSNQILNHPRVPSGSSYAITKQQMNYLKFSGLIM